MAAGVEVKCLVSAALTAQVLGRNQKASFDVSLAADSSRRPESAAVFMWKTLKSRRLNVAGAISVKCLSSINLLPFLCLSAFLFPSFFHQPASLFLCRFCIV